VAVEQVIPVDEGRRPRKEFQADVQDGRIADYRVNAKVSFVLEE
jgi:hypothetical protein